MPEPMKATPVSRTHELIRHRHFSYAQLSQREVKTRQRHFINPDGPTGRRVIAAVEATLSAESPPPRPGPENVSAGHTDPTTNHQQPQHE